VSAGRAPPPGRPPPVGLVAALVAEARSAGAHRPAPGEIVACGALSICPCGMGPQRARAAAERLLDAGAAALVSWGTAGALAAELAPGDLILPRQVICGDESWSVDPDWHARLLQRLDGADACAAPIAHSDHPLTGAVARAALARTGGAVAVDMESAAVARLARARGVPLLVVRAIADSTDMHLPALALRSIDAYGRARPLALLGGLARAPHEVAALLRLFGAARRALVRLAGVRRRAGTDLGFAARGPEQPCDHGGARL